MKRWSFLAIQTMKIKAQKLHMTQIWQDTKVVPVTILKVKENTLENLEVGKKVTISGKSKGRGFQGVVKRHGFHGMDKTHGTKHHERAPGSIGPTDPARTLPGRKMAGQMGQETVTIKNLEIIELRPNENTVYIKGAVPGMKGSNIEIRVKNKENQKDK